MRERVLAAATAAGRDPAEITCACNVEVRVGSDGDPRPSVVSGPPGAVADRLAGFRALGFTAINVISVGPDRDEQVARLAEQVLPAVRAAW